VDDFLNDHQVEMIMQIIECLGGLYGFRPALEPYISDPMRHVLFRAIQRRPKMVLMQEWKDTSGRRQSRIDYGTLDWLIEQPHFPRSLYDKQPGLTMVDMP
jgi:hypothetical protein